MKVFSPQIFLAAVLALTLTACGSSPLEAVSDFNREFDFSKVHNIAIQPIDRANLNSIKISDMQVDRINEALATDLRRKGLTIVSDNKQADLFLTWHLVTQEKTDVRTSTTPNTGMHYRGIYGYNRAAMYNCWACGTNTEVTVSEYTLGSLVVDLIDPALKKSVWRGVVQSRLKDKAERRQEVFNEVANELFTAFPPAP